MSHDQNTSQNKDLPDIEVHYHTTVRHSPPRWVPAVLALLCFAAGYTAKNIQHDGEIIDLNQQINKQALDNLDRDRDEGKILNMVHFFQAQDHARDSMVKVLMFENQMTPAGFIQYRNAMDSAAKANSAKYPAQ
jgi:hypothetical protein